MGKSTALLLRLCGALLFAAIGSLLAQWIAATFLIFSIDVNAIYLLGGLIGFAIGWILFPRPVQQLQTGLAALTPEQLGGVVIGSLLGTVMAVLFSLAEKWCFCVSNSRKTAL